MNAQALIETARTPYVIEEPTLDAVHRHGVAAWTFARGQSPAMLAIVREMSGSSMAYARCT